MVSIPDSRESSGRLSQVSIVADRFTGVEAIARSELLSLTLKETIPLLSAINTEKVRSLVNHCPNTLERETTAPISGQFISHI